MQKLPIGKLCNSIKSSVAPVDPGIRVVGSTVDFTVIDCTDTALGIPFMPAMTGMSGFGGMIEKIIGTRSLLRVNLEAVHF